MSSGLMGEAASAAGNYDHVDSSLQRLSENQRSGPTACFISPSTKFTIPQPYAVGSCGIVLLTFICLLM